MRKQLFLATLFSMIFISSIESMSQSKRNSPFEKGWHYGTRIGANIVNYNSSNPPNHFRPMADIFIEYRFTKSVGLNLGIGYSDQLIYEGRLTGGSPPAEKYINNHLLTLPLTATFKIIGPVSINTGAAFGFRLNKARYKDGIFNVSVPIGLSYTTKFGLLFDARYHIAHAGFTQLSVGYKF